MFQDFKGLTSENTVKYFLILTALEENLAEYVNIRHDLEDVSY